MGSTFVESVTLYEPAAGPSYSIEFVAHCTGVPRHRIGVYCRAGVITTSGNPDADGWRFSRESIAELRRAEEVRARVGDNPGAIRLVLQLSHQVAELQRQLRAARGE